MIFDELWRAERAANKRVDQTWKDYQPKLEEARKKGKEEYQSLLNDFFWVKDQIEEKAKTLRTRRWVDRAARSAVGIPPVNEEGLWERSMVSGEDHLTNAGVSYLIRRINAEREERIKYWTLWIRNAAVPLTGLLGTLIGLILTLRSCGKR